MICDRASGVAFTVTSMSSRSTASSGGSSTILITGISLLSCFVTCSSGAESASTTIVIRLKRSSSVGLTASETMLKPRRGEQPGDAREHTELVLDEHAEDVVLHGFVHVSSRSFAAMRSRVSDPGVGSCAGSRMTSSFDVPAATIGYTFSR